MVALLAAAGTAAVEQVQVRAVRADAASVRADLKKWSDTPSLVAPEAVRAAILADPAMLREGLLKLQEQIAEDRRVANIQLVENARAELLQPAAGILGNPAGTHVMVEFFDDQCPHCRDAIPAVQGLLKADPELKVVLRDVPMLGDGSVLAARAAQAAGLQGKYMPMHDAMMSAPVPITKDEIEEAAKGIGLDVPRMETDMMGEEVTSSLNANISLSRRVGVTGTPTFVMPGRGSTEGFKDQATLQAFIDGKKPS